MSALPSLGKLEFVPLREVWDNEATSFTPWLLENEEALGDVLGIDIALTKNEKRVGSFSLDLIGKNLTDDSKLIVENQLERTNHSHLGQLLTYAGGIEPSTIVWVASEVRDEHRAALDWLNRVTDSETHFFGVVIKAVRIGESAPAPWLDLVVKPNSWNEITKTASGSNDLSPSEARYQRFWSEFLDRYRDQHEAFANKQPVTRQASVVSTGVAGVIIGLNVQNKQLKGDLFLNDTLEKNLARFEFLKGHRQEIEETFGAELSWEPLESSRACRVGYYGEGSVLDEDAWHQHQDWLFDVALRFVRVTELPWWRQMRDV
jgi:hypothetical protein